MERPLKLIHQSRFRLSSNVFASFVALIALVAAGCASATSTPTQTPPPTVTTIPATATPSGPTATPTPDLAELLKDGGIAIVLRAYDRLLDQYIDPLEPSALLGAAWEGAAAQAVTQGVAVPPYPSLAGDRATDFAAFSAAYVQLTAGLPDPKEIRFAAIRGMAESLADCHTFFLGPVASTTLDDARSGKGIVGVGIELSGVPPLVTEVIASGPAEKAGVLVGDRIAAVDGVDASAWGPAAAFERINGDEGTPVRLRLTRPDAAPLEVTITRARVTPPNVSSRIVGDAIGYVRIRNWVDDGVTKPLRDALTALDAQGTTRWIIDLRDNPGGRLDTGAMSLFVREGVILRERGRGGALREETSSGETLPVLRPTVLLTNNRTGSVSEMFVAALDEYGVADVVGAKTNACVGFTDVQPLGDGSSLAVTTHVMHGPVTNAPLNGVGVIPDQVVARTADDIAAGRDPQLDAAIARLSQ